MIFLIAILFVIQIMYRAKLNAQRLQAQVIAEAQAHAHAQAHVARK